MKKLIVKCPGCTKEHDYYQSKPWSPFCSERCRLIDLGAWASEEHRIKGESVSLPDNLSDETTVNKILQ
ncbi:MAG: DNA gyrase inhibitor YacG [gamma proteobacterium symbiont of Bathyaustriella thionipta]|nr:DNA gyrase inhibitor YacG [gamma proteobacterium symbiont of Bathyaustriella thionipta]MCU7950181.1 DNA gyrase inhibitor YacG [gamma proteobacterium symbiont of Bathyaustriella thionipta]MCU7953891.1 DNA gyrase inhibitor YacG [gamma proteobacterium symbiont of Bathyaustriella thionipta]MCU7955013.1 DNA gyrase inhibitor YacG [gamma proteobacterium symbiont of Bathyaustriella thionipta]MCU7966867.1 DNA gyrase inhibitor YacG [gamma proteobacterium symbiont of Bathyaustriella thionipta]